MQIRVDVGVTELRIVDEKYGTLYVATIGILPAVLAFFQENLILNLPYLKLNARQHVKKS
jgi:hypothetical protein